MNAQTIADFIDNGGNVLVAANENAGEAIRQLAIECGLEISEEKAIAIDHFNFDVNDNGVHSLLVLNKENLISAKTMVGNKNKLNPILYRGVGIASDPNNELVLDVLVGSATTYAYNPSKKISHYPHAVGRNTGLISALQARNNARVLFSGSLEFFSDEFFRSSVKSKADNKEFEKSGNQDLALALSAWVFKEEGVLRVSNVTHFKKSESSPPESYTIMEDVEFWITIETLKDGNWIPFKADDIQLEFVRIDPFVRTTLKFESDRYVGRFRIPDVYGVYQFKVDYKRIGYTYLYSTTLVSVRPLEHTQYERFIFSAYPYYLSAFSMMIGVYLFSFVFLYFNDKDQQTSSVDSSSKTGAKNKNKKD